MFGKAKRKKGNREKERVKCCFGCTDLDIGWLMFECRMFFYMIAAFLTWKAAII